MFILAIIGYAFLAIYEFTPLYKQKLWHDFWTNTILGSCSFTIAILLCLGVKIPSPVAPIKDFITSIFGK